MMKIALVPGTFDPITKGHLDVIERASKIFHEVVVAVAASENKNPLFDLDTREQLARNATAHMNNVSVVTFNDLLVDVAKRQHAHIVVKGLRAVTDFEYEFQLTALNYKMDSSLETFFIMSPPNYMYLSSSVVREIARHGGPIGEFVTDEVAGALHNKYFGPKCN